MTSQNIYVRRFSPSPPLLLGESTFTVPPPIPKTVQKRPFASYIYIEKGRPFWLLFASFFPSVEKRPRKVGGISSSPTKFLMPDPCVISSS